MPGRPESSPAPEGTRRAGMVVVIVVVVVMEVRAGPTIPHKRSELVTLNTTCTYACQKYEPHIWQHNNKSTEKTAALDPQLICFELNSINNRVADWSLPSNESYKLKRCVQCTYLRTYNGLPPPLTCTVMVNCLTRARSTGWIWRT